MAADYVRTLRFVDAGVLAEEIGQLLNAMAANIMQLLNARAAAKTLSRSGHRTLIQSTENNPLKFMPTPEEALRVMLGAKSTSYLGGRQSVEGGFADLKMHQMATLSAMQLAVTRLLADLSPDAVKTAVGGQGSSPRPRHAGCLYGTFRRNLRHRKPPQKPVKPHSSSSRCETMGLGFRSTASVSPTIAPAITCGSFEFSEPATPMEPTAMVAANNASPMLRRNTTSGSPIGAIGISKSVHQCSC